MFYMMISNASTSNHWSNSSLVMNQPVLYLDLDRFSLLLRPVSLQRLKLRSIIIKFVSSKPRMFEDSCSNYSECLQNAKERKNKHRNRFSRYFIQSVPYFKDGLFSENSINNHGLKGRGRWTLKEQKTYIEFLRQNMEEMRDKTSRKSEKVFLKMSRKIKTRSADQCRSHHQKILKYHNSLEETIKFFEEDVFEKHDLEECKPSDDPPFTKDNFYHMQIFPGNTIRIVINEKAIKAY